MTLTSLRERTGHEVAVSKWFLITPERIEFFAEATEDRQWIHLDRERAERESPYGTTVAHGFLTLSMLSHLSRNLLEIVKMGSFIRARFTLVGVKDFAEGADLTLAVIVELQGSEKPCCVAEWIVRYYTA